MKNQRLWHRDVAALPNVDTETGQSYMDVLVSDESYRSKQIMGDDVVVLYFSLSEYIEFPLGIYIVFQGVEYSLVAPATIVMVNSCHFDLTLYLESPSYSLKKYLFRNPVDHRTRFSYTAKPREHVQMICDNLNSRGLDGTWEVGVCVEAVEKLVSYDYNYCQDALRSMAEAFETEYEIVHRDDVHIVNLHKIEYNKNAIDALALRYGKGNGLKSGLQRAIYGESKRIEVLNVQGGERNIDRGTYGNDTLLLPPDGTQIAFDGTDFITSNTTNSQNEVRVYEVISNRTAIRRADKALRTYTEGALDCSEIYPHREGTVSGVEPEQSDESPIYRFKDENNPVDYSAADIRIKGETAVIVFQSGMLAGREFEMLQSENRITGYDHETKTWTLRREEIDGVMMPGGVFVPAVGDRYAVFNISLPEEYVTEAENEMLLKAVRYLYENEEQKFTYTGEVDGLWSKRDWENIGGKLKVGAYVRFSDPRFQVEDVLIRITGIRNYINNPYAPTVELSNDTIGSSLTGRIAQLESQEVVEQEQRTLARQYTKRRFRDALETMSALGEALGDRFTQGISPITVQTMGMLIGDESLQFRFVNSRTNPQKIDVYFVWDNARQILYSTASPAADSTTLYNNPTESSSHSIRRFKPNAKDNGSNTIILQHQTYGLERELRAEHKPEEYRYWTMPNYESAPLTDSKRRFLYAKVPLEGDTGEFRLEETAIADAMSGADGYLYLLVGILNAEYDGDRSFVSVYGFTEILPGRITTDRIVSTDGLTYFDLANGEIGGIIKFLSDNGYETIIDGGYIKTKLIDTDTLIVKNVRAEAGGNVVNIAAETAQVRIYAEGNTDNETILEGNSYDSIDDLYGDEATGYLTLTSNNVLTETITAQHDFPFENYLTKTVVISERLSTTPVEFTFSGSLRATVFYDTTQETAYGTSRITAFLTTYTSDGNNLIQRQLIATIYSSNDTKTNTFSNVGIKAATGLHRLEIEYSLFSNDLRVGSNAYYGFTLTRYNFNFYVSRYFANGFCLGSRQDNYIMAWKDRNERMQFAYRNEDTSVEIGDTGLKVAGAIGGNIRIISEGTSAVLSDTDHDVLNRSATSISITLPQNPMQGQQIRIWHTRETTITLQRGAQLLFSMYHGNWVDSLQHTGKEVIYACYIDDTWFVHEV